MIEQQLDVFAPLAQRRHDEVHDVQTVVEVFAELLAPHLLEQVAIGRRNHAHVDDGAGLLGADALNLAVLEEPQQHALHAQAHLADFVEQDRAAVGRLEKSRAIAIRAREAAAHVAEEFRFEQPFGHAGAIDCAQAVHGDAGSARGSGARGLLYRHRSRQMMSTFESLAAMASASSRTSRMAGLAPIKRGQLSTARAFALGGVKSSCDMTEGAPFYT